MSSAARNSLAKVRLKAEISKRSPRNGSLLQSGFSVCGAPEPRRWISWWSPLSLMPCWATRAPGDAATHYRDPGWRRGGGEKRKSFVSTWQRNFRHEASLTHHFPASTATPALQQSSEYVFTPQLVFSPPLLLFFCSQGWSGLCCHCALRCWSDHGRASCIGSDQN